MLTEAELFPYLKQEATDEAQQFAEEVKFDLVKLTEKIAERRSLIDYLLRGGSDSVNPGSSSRYWIDCYVAALEEILESRKCNLPLQSDEE
jgi:hypothetical protein